MLWIGLTGGLGAGKSTVLSLLKEQGHCVLSADTLVQEFLSSQKGVQGIKNLFGEIFLTSEGTVHRKKLSQWVFQNKKELEKLENFIYPRIKEKKEMFKKEMKEKKTKIVFYEIPLLFEKKQEESFDRIICVVASQKQREFRWKERDFDMEDFRSREKHQTPQEEKAQRSHFVITNNGSLQELKNQLQDILKQLSC